MQALFWREEEEEGRGKGGDRGAKVGVYKKKEVKDK